MPTSANAAFRGANDKMDEHWQPLGQNTVVETDISI
jgi:predicted SnoaL-like aldol condensation-catalyzing enzyme